MTCTKAQLLALLKRIRKEILQCSSVECCLEVLDRYIEIAEDRAGTEAWLDLIT